MKTPDIINLKLTEKGFNQAKNTIERSNEGLIEEVDYCGSCWIAQEIRNQVLNVESVFVDQDVIVVRFFNSHTGLCDTSEWYETNQKIERAILVFDSWLDGSENQYDPSSMFGMEVDLKKFDFSK